MKTLLAFAVLCMTAQSALAYDYYKEFYYKVNAVATPTGAGSVYVQYSNNEPSAADYAAESSDTGSHEVGYDEGDSEPMSTSSTSMNLWAKPAPGFKFDGWALAEAPTQIISTDAHFAWEDFEITSTDRENPTTFNYIATFSELTGPLEGKYFLKNKEAGLYITNGQWWGTHATLDAAGLEFECAKLEDGTYTLKDAMGYFTENEYIDTPNPTNWTIKHIGGGNFEISIGDKKVGADGINVVVAADAKNAVWEFVDVADVYAQAQKADYDNPADATCYVKNPGFTSKKNNAWTFAGIGNDNLDGGATAGNFTPESWNSASFSASQTITGLKEGIYRIKLNGYYRYNVAGGANDNSAAIAAHADGSEVINAYIEANGQIKDMLSVADEAAVLALDCKTPNNVAEAQAAFAKGLYVNVIECYVGADGELKLAIKKDEQANTDWCIFDDVRLEYLGGFPNATLVSDDDELDQDAMASFVASPSSYKFIVTFKGNAPIDIDEDAISNITLKLGTPDEDGWYTYEAIEGAKASVVANKTEEGVTFEITFTGFTPEYSHRYRAVCPAGLFSLYGMQSKEYTMTITTPEDMSGIKEIAASDSSVSGKFIDGKNIVIVKNGKMYTVAGTAVK